MVLIPVNCIKKKILLKTFSFIIYKMSHRMDGS